MKAVVLHELGGPELLRVEQVATPRPDDGEVLVRVEACGICYHDLLTRSGKLGQVPLPLIPGNEIAGEVVEVGRGVHHVQPGTRVAVYPRLFCGACRHCLAGRQDLCRNSGTIGTDAAGGYAEFLTLPARNLVPVPAGLDPTAAAIAACPIGTSLRAAHGVARLALGETVLITGAGGGLGLHQIQIAKLLGATVIATSSSPAKEAMLREAGADHVVVSPDLRFGRAVWELTGKQGVDVVLENVVSGTFEDSLRALGPHGRMVVLGNVQVVPVPLNPGLVIARRLQVFGSGNCTFAELELALRLLADGRLRPVIGLVAPFHDASRAHALIEDRQVVGRAVLTGW